MLKRLAGPNQQILRHITRSVDHFEPEIWGAVTGCGGEGERIVNGDEPIQAQIGHIEEIDR